jgi:hypothetical protein
MNSTWSNLGLNTCLCVGKTECNRLIYCSHCTVNVINLISAKLNKWKVVGWISFSRDRMAEDLWADVASIRLPDHSRGQLTHMHFQFIVIGWLGYSATLLACRIHRKAWQYSKVRLMLPDTQWSLVVQLVAIVRDTQTVCYRVQFTTTKCKYWAYIQQGNWGTSCRMKGLGKKTGFHTGRGHRFSSAQTDCGVTAAQIATL